MSFSFGDFYPRVEDRVIFHVCTVHEHTLLQKVRKGLRLALRLSYRNCWLSCKFTAFLVGTGQQICFLILTTTNAPTTVVVAVTFIRRKHRGCQQVGLLCKAGE